MIEIDVVGAGRSGFESYGLADHKGDGLGLRLPTTLVVVVLRSALCNISCASSWTRVENSSASDCPGRMAIFPP